MPPTRWPVATSSSAASDGLPPEQRAILVLRHYVGLEPAEIAETLGIPAGAGPAARDCITPIAELRAALEADARPAVARGRTA